MSKYDSLKENDIYNHWKIISYVGKKHNKDIYLCECDCNDKTKKEVEGRNLVTNKSKSCGCMKKVEKEIQKENRKKYKAKYFQENKEKIMKRNHENLKNYDKSVILNYHLKSKYKTSLNEIQYLYDTQEGRCAICNIELKTSWILDIKSSNGKNRMVIDHNHETGKVRGLLCHNCNVSLGLLKDDVEILKSAIKYLEKDGITYGKETC